MNFIMAYDVNKYYYKAIDRNKTYYFSIEAVNENGVSVGYPVVKVE